MIIWHLLKAVLLLVSNLSKVLYDHDQCCLSEYLITKYGNGKAVPPESGLIDNLYCEIRNILSGSIRNWHTYSVSHYAEGTLMPIIIQRMIFNFAHKNAPIGIQPAVKTVFGQLKNSLVEPEIKKNSMMVCGGNLLLKIFNFWFGVVSVLDWSASRKIKIYFFRRRTRTNCQFSKFKIPNEQQLTSYSLFSPQTIKWSFRWKHSF